MAQTSEATGEKSRGGMTGRSVLHAVKRRPLTLFAVVLLAAGAATAVWFFLPLPKSTAVVVFQVGPAPGPFFQGGGGDGGAFRQAQLTLMKRRLTLNTVLKQPGIQQLGIIREQSDPLAWL